MASSFQRFVHSFQQQTLLGVHRVGLIGANIKKRRVEHTDIFIQQIAMSNIRRSVLGSIVMIKAGGI